jgi:hypothetical protein
VDGVQAVEHAAEGDSSREPAACDQQKQRTVTEFDETFA